MGGRAAAVSLGSLEIVEDGEELSLLKFIGDDDRNLRRGFWSALNSNGSSPRA